MESAASTSSFDKQKHQAELPWCGSVATSQNGAARTCREWFDRAARVHELARARAVPARRHEIERLGLDLRLASSDCRPCREPQRVRCDSVRPSRNAISTMAWRARTRLHQLLARHEFDLSARRQEPRDPACARGRGPNGTSERPSTSSIAMRCCTLTSGIGALSTVRAERVGRCTWIVAMSAGGRFVRPPSGGEAHRAPIAPASRPTIS